MQFLISKRWRQPKIIIVFFLLEFAFTIPALALFGIADPDLYRTRLWEDGYKNGFNSNPLEILYSYANYEPIHYPLVWSPFITSYNVIISVFSTFLLLIKAVLFILHWWIPLLSTLIHALLVGLWAFSAYAQSAPDVSDPTHPQTGAPWYIKKECEVAFYRGNIGYCRQAKAAFAVTIILLILFALNTVWALWSMIPTRDQRLSRKMEMQEEKELRDMTNGPSGVYLELNDMHKGFEAGSCGSMKATATATATPRTVTIQRLEG